MRILISLIFFCYPFSVDSQELNKLDFEIIIFETKEVIKSLKQADIGIVVERLSFNNNLTNSLDSILNENKNDFLNASVSKKYIFPSYKLTQINNKLELTIVAQRVIDRKYDGKEYSDFYFVIKTIVNYNKSNMTVIFEKTTVLLKETEIIDWWFSQWKNYVKEGKKVYELYGYRPPPPSCPPFGIKSLVIDNF